MGMYIFSILFAGTCFYLANYASHMNAFYNTQRIQGLPYNEFWMPAFSFFAILFYSLAFWTIIDIILEMQKRIVCG